MCVIENTLPQAGNEFDRCEKYTLHSEAIFTVLIVRTNHETQIITIRATRKTRKSTFEAGNSGSHLPLEHATFHRSFVYNFFIDEITVNFILRKKAASNRGPLREKIGEGLADSNKDLHVKTS